MRVFLIAGEPSGDALGGALMAGLRTLVPGVTFDGIGGPEMQAHGLTSRFPMEELSLMGLVEILPKYLHLKRRIAETAQAVADSRPDVLITVDAPDFCFRVARAVRARSEVRIVHYVSPTVWAWRPGRAAKLAKLVDQVLALFPFEPPYLEAHGLRCDFVGHPIAMSAQAAPDAVAAFRAEVAGADPLLLVLPGSRRGEVRRLVPIFGAALARFAESHPQLRVVVPAAGPVAAEVANAIAAWPGTPVVLDPRGQDPDAFALRKRTAFAAADLALAASGTVSLELARAETPMVIAYDMNPITRVIVAQMLRVDTATLVNLVSETRAVPEFLGRNCRPAQISDGLAAVLSDPEAQRDAMRVTMERLGAGGDAPGLRAARAVLDGLDQG